MSAPDVRASVVVPAYAVADRITRQLDALAPQVVALGGEIVVVDDASPDATGAVAAEWATAHPEVRCTVVRADVRHGVNASRNAGILVAASEVIALADGDDVVLDGWVGALAVAVTPSVVAAGRFAWPGEQEARAAPPFYGVDLPTAMGGSMAFHRSVFDAVDGFDEELRNGGTETEFVLRAVLTRGVTVADVPHAVVEYHLPPVRSGRRRREAAQHRGFALVARRLRELPGAPRSTFTLRRRFRDALGSVGRAVLGGGPGRSASWDRFLVDLVGLVAIVRFSLACPPRRGVDPDRVAAGYRVLAGPNAVPGG